MNFAAMQLLHSINSHIELEREGVTLFRYTYDPTIAPVESPRPCFHPLRTLGGKLVTGFRPHDHRWHQGLSLTSAFLSGHNFWGGPTCVDGAYQQLNNNGAQLPQSWDSLQVAGAGNLASMRHHVIWKTQSNQPLLVEKRVLQMKVRPDLGFWVLQWNSRLTSVSEEPLHWGSPTTQGRENAGYGGLFWRGPREFVGGKILSSVGREGPDMMGQRSPWLAYIGSYDGIDETSTLVFVDDPKNPRYPSKWFVRNTTPMVCPNFSFDREYVQQPGEILRLGYKIVIADGAWNRERIEDAVKRCYRSANKI